jgi:hypothetical protein
MQRPSGVQMFWSLMVVMAGLALVACLWLGRSYLLHWLPSHGVWATRWVAVSFLICDLAISVSLLTLLITRERRPPVWAERRLPYRGRWLWYFLIGLTILCYAALAPTFLFLYVRMIMR